VPGHPIDMRHGTARRPGTGTGDIQMQLAIIGSGNVGKALAVPSPAQATPSS
jgi:hypothetical protein